VTSAPVRSIDPLKRNVDLFEIGFAFLLLPLMVSTLDQPLHLGALALLWLGTWFLLRLDPLLPAQMLEGWRRFPLVRRILWTLTLALFGALWTGLRSGGTSVAPWLAGAAMVPVRAVLFSLPLCTLGLFYAPRRFQGRGWIPSWLLAILPALLFAGLHIACASWVAVAAAFLGGLLCLKGMLPLWLCAGLHAALSWIGGTLPGLW
jgi:hypothetical protein